MILIKKILKYLVVILVVLTATAYLLPREVTVTRSIHIDAPADVIFGLVNALQESEKWSPWLKKDPEIVLTYSGPDAGVGSKLAWASDHPEVGTGSEIIVESVEDQKVVTALDFGPEGTATATFTLSANSLSTGVTWDLVADMGNNPIGRYMGLMMDNWVGADYEQGLANLKAVAEGT